MKNVSMLAHAMRSQDNERRQDVHALIHTFEDEFAALHNELSELLQRVRRLEGGSQISG